MSPGQTAPRAEDKKNLAPSEAPSATEGKDLRLPETAFRPLAPGETYQPLVPATAAAPEVTVRSIVQGLLWSVVFSAAATYIVLKLGQGIESAIPISILAVGASTLLVKLLRKRPSTLLENVNVLAIGATSGIVAGGSVFTMPAIFILGLEERSSFWQIFIVPLLGAILGVFLLAPFRRYFTRDLHGQLPFPEARATTEILVAGNRGGQSALILSWSAATAAVFDFVGPSMRGWADTFTTAKIGALAQFTERFKAVFTMNTSAAIFGLGYIMGVDYAAIILAGSMVSFFVLVPLIGWLGAHVASVIPPAAVPLSAMDADAIFHDYVRPIGIGGIFAAGLISILKMSPVIVRAARQAFSEVARLARSGGAAATGGETSERTDRALPMWVNLLGIIATCVFIAVYFGGSVLRGEPDAIRLTLTATALTLLIAFLFTAVSAWAIAMISVTPISGMTLTTLIVTAVVLSALGLSGQSGMLQTLLIGGVVCTALSMAGSLVTQYKIAYWLGATPRNVEVSNVLGAVVASLATTAVIFLMAKVYGFGAGSPLPAPQPNAMAAVLRGVMGSGGAPWFLYGVGAVFAIVLEMCGVSGLAFALGLYLPMDLNSPLVFGAGVAWLLKHSSKDEAVSTARHEKGTLVASGFIAGGALVGVLAALLKFLEDRFQTTLIPDLTTWAHLGPFLTGWSNWLGLFMFLALGGWVYWVSRRTA